MKPSRKSLGLWLTLCLGIAILLTVIFRQQIRTIIVEPVSYVIWYAQLIVNTVPQHLF